jgi:hypothetical protein
VSALRARTSLKDSVDGARNPDGAIQAEGCNVTRVRHERGTMATTTMIPRQRLASYFAEFRIEGVRPDSTKEIVTVRRVGLRPVK